MIDEIRVHVVKMTSSPNFYMRYVDPATGKQVARSTGTNKKAEATKVAAVWEDELRSGRYQKPAKMGWQEFREFHETNKLDGMRAATVVAYQSSLNVFERLTRPHRLADCTTAKITAFATALRQGRSPATVKRHLGHLRAVLRWAHNQGLLPKVPRFEIPKVPKGMKGRPITLEEFERMLMAIPKGLELRPVVGEQRDVAGSWEFYLRGLWASGLRLSESLHLRWDDAPGAVVVDLSGRRPMLRIPAEAEKGNRNRLLPITPEFASLLASVPPSERRGYVFAPRGLKSKLVNRCDVGRHLADIGRAANVVTKDGKFATAHDLRRAFGFRWSRKVMPTVLRELMRHESIETTMTFYVGQNAEATADALWAAAGESSGESRDNWEPQSATPNRRKSFA